MTAPHRPGGRRGFLAAAGALGAVLAARAAPLVGAPADRLLPPSRGRRAVIVGGGWGGLSAARQLRETGCCAPGWMSGNRELNEG